MALSDRQILHSLSRMPFIDSVELALILGEPHATVHRGLTGLLDDGIAGRASYGAAHLPSSRRYYLTTNGIRHAAGLLGFDTPSDFARAYQWDSLYHRMRPVGGRVDSAGSLVGSCGNSNNPLRPRAPLRLCVKTPLRLCIFEPLR